MTVRELPADIDGARPGGAPRRWTTGSPSSCSRTSPTARARWPTSPAITRLATTPARSCSGTCRTPWSGRCRSSCRRGRRPRRRLHRTSTSTAGPGRRRSSTCGRTCRRQLRSPIQGWFGQRDQFAMGPVYEPATGIERFGVGTPPVLAMAAVEVGARLVAEAGIDRLAAKGRGHDRRSWSRWPTPGWPARRPARLAARPGPPRLARTLAHPQAWQLTQALIDARVVPGLPHAGPGAARAGAALHPVRRRLGRDGPVPCAC